MEDLEKDIPNIKKKIKNVLKSVFKAKKLLIVVIIILVLIFISAMDYFKVINDGEEWQTNDNDEKRGSTRYESNVSPTVYDDGSGGGLKVDKNALIKDALIDRKFSEDKISGMTDEEIIDVLKINKKLKKKPKVTSLNELTEAEILWCMDDVYSDYLKKPEELEKLLNAEIITQYPKMGDGATDANGRKKLDGIIQFERYPQEGGKSKTLKFIKAETFNSYVSNGDDRALDYFTLDDEQNAVIAYKNTTIETLESNDSKMVLSDYAPDLSESDKGSDGNYEKTTVSIGTEKINYKNATQKYVMPFKYLWSLLVIGRDRDFVSELADLVENSKITISIYDNVTTTTDTDVFTYKKQNRTDTRVDVTPSTTYGVNNVPTNGYWWPDNRETPTIGIKKNPDVETEDTDYKITHTVVNKINRVEFALTKADVWIVDYSQEYTYQEAQVTSNESNTKDMDPKETEYEPQEEGSGNSKDNALLLNCDHAKEMIKITTDYIEKHKPTSSRAQTMGTDSNSRVPSASGNTKKPNSSSGSKSTNSVFGGVLSGENINDNVTLTPNNGGSSTSGGTSSTTETEQPLQVTATYVKVERFQRKIERKESTTNTVSEQKYVSKTPISNPKDDKDADKDNFVKILRKGKHREAKDYLTDDATSWLWKIMRGNGLGDNFIDLTKYLFYKVTGKNYGVTEFEFSIFDSNGFVDFDSSGSASDLLIEYIHSWEGANPPTSADGTKYKIEDDGYGNLVVGYGVDIYNCGHTELFKQAGYTLALGAEIDKDFVDSIEKMEIENKTSEIRNAISGLNLTEYQINAMISRAYNSGGTGAISKRNGKNFVEAYKAYWDQSRDDKFSKKDSNADFGHQLYTTYMYLPNTAKDPKTKQSVYSKGVENRRKSEWRLFQTGYYDRINKWHSEGGGTVIEVAQKIHSYMEQNKYTYCVLGGNSYEECPGRDHGLNITFEASKKGYHHTCCATYVSWVLQEAGYLSDSEHSNSASGLQQIMKSKGFQMITNEADLQAGDVLCYSSHVEIYAGDNKIYNAGSGNAIRNASPAKRTRAFNYALRPVK